MEFLLIATILLVLGAELVNGATDAPNAIATVVPTFALPLRVAIAMAVVMNFLGAYLSIWLGAGVATTIGRDIVDGRVIDLVTIMAAMVAIVIWSGLAWHWGLPTSESHALVAGLAGAGLATAGFDVLLWQGWQKVLIGLGASTFCGFIVSLLMAWLLRTLAAPFPPFKTGALFRLVQILSASAMAFSHGVGDGQKFMGVFALVLVIHGGLAPENFVVPSWVVIVCATTMGIGTSFGGVRIIRTLGFKMVKLQPYQGFAAEISATLVIMLTAWFGMVLSTTHTIGTAIMGAGVASLNAAVVRKVLLAWFSTFFIAGGLGYIVVSLARLILH